MKQSEEWPRQWTAEIGAALARHRKRRGLSAAKLSERCAEIGFPIPRNTIANLENGRKESVPIHEVVTLADALGVSPLDLLFPAALGPEVHCSPSGKPERVVPAYLDFRHGRGNSEESELALYERHWSYVANINYCLKNQDGRLPRWADSLRDLRELMGAKGLRLPELASPIAHALREAEMGMDERPSDGRLEAWWGSLSETERESALQDSASGHISDATRESLRRAGIVTATPKELLKVGGANG